MKKIRHKCQQSATVINQKKLVNRNWKNFFVALSLICAGNVASADGVTSEKAAPNPLIKAVNLNDISAIKSLQKSSDVNYQDADGWTPLMHATRQANVEIMKLLLDPGKLSKVFKKAQKANPNIQNYNNQSPLMMAVSDDNRSNNHIELLLKYKANVNLQNVKGQTALMFAASKGKADRVALLIKNGADVNIKDDNGQNALMYAAISGHEEVIPLLINAGVSQLTKRTSADPISQAKAVLKIIDERDNNNWTALMHAVKNNQHKVVESLIKLKADLNCKDKNGRTALMIAAEQINYEMTERLISANANLNLQDEDGKTALIVAVTSEAAKVAENSENSNLFLLIQLLARHHADVNMEDENDNSALIYMVNSDEKATEKAAFDNMLTVSELLANKANPNAKKGWDISGIATEFDDATALMIAVMRGKVKLIQPLINFGANLDDTHVIQEDDGHTYAYDVIGLAERELAKLQKSTSQALVEKKTKNLKEIISILEKAIAEKKKKMITQRKKRS